MAEYIEFIGVPGVGKTATYEYLKNIHKDADKWIPFSSDERGRSQDRLQSFFGKVLRIKKRAPLNEKELLESFIADNPRLLDLFWDAIASDLKDVHGKDLRFHSVDYLSKIIKRVERVRNQRIDKMAIVDEGLLHNISYFTRSNVQNDYQQQVKHALALMRLPKGVVFFDGDLETIMRRTMARSNVIFRDAQLTKDLLVKSRMESITKKHACLNCLESIKLPVLHLSCHVSIEDKANSITDFINGFS